MLEQLLQNGEVQSEKGLNQERVFKGHVTLVGDLILKLLITFLFYFNL